MQILARLADPAAEEFQYPVSFDVRDLVTLEDVVAECQLGPNGYVHNAQSTMPQYCANASQQLVCATGAFCTVWNI